MNRIILLLFFSFVLLLTACGQYGDLYAPPAEQLEEIESTQETQEQKDLQQAEEDLAE